MLTSRDIVDWENHPVTKKLKELITQSIEFNSQQLSYGSLLDHPDIGNKYNYNVGFMDGLRFILNAELIEEEKTNDIFRDSDS